MRIAVMGSGGLGGYFGARLASGGADVHFIARGKHLQAMRSEGLRVEGPDPIQIPHAAATDDPAEVGVVDLVMFCVKLWDTESALQQIRPLVGPGTAIISFQNGVLKDQHLRAAYDAGQIMGGVGYVATTIDRPGVIRQTGPLQNLLFGEFDGSRSPEGWPSSGPVWRAESGRALRQHPARDMAKCVFLVGLSGATTTIRLPIGPIREHPQAAPCCSTMRGVARQSAQCRHRSRLRRDPPTIGGR